MINSTINKTRINSVNTSKEILLDKISFDNFNLQNGDIVIEADGFSFRDYANRDINLTDNPQADGQILNDVFFRGREIPVIGWLRADTSAELDVLIDEFKLKLSKINKDLKWKVNGETRKIKATVKSLTFSDKKNIAINYNITFLSQDSYWTKNKSQSFLIENNSQNDFTEIVNNIGNKVYPLIVIGFKDLITSDNLSIKVNNIGITINTTFSDNDILIINGIEKKVLLNGIEIDYDGIFPILNNGENSVNILFNNAVKYDATIIFNNKIL